MSVQMHIQIEATHRQAGFPEIRFEVIQRRFWQLLCFLAQHGYVVKPIPATLDDVGPTTALMNADISDEGYLFIQRYEGKWVGRLYEDKGAEAEEKFLKKWHTQFLTQCTSA